MVADEVVDENRIADRRRACIWPGQKYKMGMPAPHRPAA